MRARSFLLFFISLLCISTNAQISGTVFRDYNGNGLKDNSSTFNEIGIAGITVTAYNASGSSIGSTTTASNGIYTIPAISGNVRIEFTWLNSSDYSGPSGSQNSSSVRFVTAPSNNIDFGINNPADYSQSFDQINIITPCFVYGHYNDPDIANEDVIVSIPYLSADPQSAKYQQNPPMIPHITEAISSQVGTVHGLAFQRSKDMLFAGAYHRTHSGFGPGGSGAIYVIDRSLPLNDPNRAKIFADVNAIFGANTAGADPHPQVSDNAGGNWYNDVRNPSDASSWVNTFNNVGKIAWGDLEISDDETTLYAVNLADRKLYVFPADATLAGTLTSADIQRYDIPLNWCVDNTASSTENDSRPFALKYKDGKLYVGVTCTAESIGAYNRNDVGLVIYEFTGSGFNTTPVFSVDGVNWGANTILFSWTPWVWGPSGTGFNPNTLRQFFLTDIEFDNQDLILGIRDRWGDQVHFNAGLPTPSNPGLSPASNLQATSFGKVLRACWNGTTWSYEGGGICGTLNGYGTLGSASVWNPGPLGTNGKYNSFYEEFASHIEASLGSLIQIPGAFEVATTAMGPTGYNSGGIIWMSNVDGQNKRPLSILTGERVGATIYNGLIPETPWYKSSGLGDVEALLDPPPIEIGNRVWTDVDSDGIQDAGEAPISGVTVQLVQGSTVIASATTDANGNYYFSNATGTNTASAIYGITQLQPNMTYIVRIPNVQGGSKQAALGTNSLTTANAGGGTPGTQADVRDSDGTLAGNNAEVTVQTTDIAVAGANNHTFDFGFSTISCTLGVTCNPTPQTNCSPVNGSATTTVTGGQGTITYVWSSGETASSISNKSAGTYTVTVTDDFLPGCTATCQAVIANNATNPSVTCAKTDNTNCATPNGTATATATGVTYLWSNNATTAMITGLAANTYTVTVTSTTTGCTATCSAQVQSTTTPPTATCTPMPNTNCVNPNGSASVSTNAANATFLWSTNATTSSISGLAAGNYTVTVTNTTTGCTNTCVATVTNGTVNPTCTITTNSQPTCAILTGGSITVNPSPTDTYTYNWSDIGSGSASRTGLTGGTYSVTVTNTTTGCTGVCNITLTTPTNCCNINSVVPQNPVCLDNGTPAIHTDNRIRFSANVTNTNTTLTAYNVSINGGTTITPNTNVPYGLTQFTLGPGTGGGGATFTITVTDSTTPGCTQTFQVTDPGGCNNTTPCPTPICGTAVIQVNNN